ncbi:MAG: DUF4856 domain-containing protein [Cytophagales bacterium]|nr:DUF4856 domain-containing protein [Cytophagales bacterium]
MFTNFKTFNRFAFSVLAVSTLTLSSCGNDDEDVVDPVEVTEPTSYDYSFENASYSGQTERLALLEGLSSTAKGASGEGVTVTAQELQTLFEKASEGGKKLSNKTDVEAKTIIEGWFADLATASTSTEAGAKGVAGRLTKSEGKVYLFDENGFEPAQLIEKGIMGACFYYQATGVEGYLSETSSGILGDNTQNEEGKDYTEAQHHWDEAFGYFGAPTTFSSESTDGARFHAKYSLKGEAANLEIADDLMKAFYLGRQALDNKDVTTAKAQAKLVKAEWELAIATAGIHYLNDAAGSNFSNDAARMHSLSEAYAFIWSLNFNEDKKITTAQVNEVLDLLGDSFWDITTEDIESASKKLAEIYGLTDSYTSL